MVPARVMSIQANYKKNHLWVSQEGALQCEDFLVTVYLVVCIFMSIQQSHSVLMTWVCCLLCSFNFWFSLSFWFCLSSHHMGIPPFPSPFLCILAVFCLCVFISLYLSHTTFVSPGCSCSLTDSTPCTGGAELLYCRVKERIWIHAANFSPVLSVFPVLFLSFLSRFPFF